jgi:hypothetical protein
VRWDGTGWTLQPTRTPGGASAAELVGVSCPSATACTAVGQDYDSAGDLVTLGETWNEARWSIVATHNYNVPVPSSLDGVSCPAANMCMAVGSSSLGGLVERWDGTRWTIVPTAAGADVALKAVSCASATACTAVGQGPGRVWAERWDGTQWTVQVVPEPLLGGLLHAVSCPTASECVAIGSNNSGSFAEIWDGTSWTIQLISGAVGLQSVSCASATICEAVGETGSPESGGYAVAAVWNGST